MTAVQAKGHAGAALVVRRAEPEPQPQPEPAPKGMAEPMTLTNPMEGKFRDFAMANLKMLMAYELKAPEHDGFHGKVLALCGAGPSLATGPIYPADELWGCNSAVNWLHENGHIPTGAVAIDQTERMLDDWYDTPDVTHYIASTINPSVTRHLIERGRRIRVIHNYVGWDLDRIRAEIDAGADEDDDELEDEEKSFYNSKPWPESFMMGTGATVLTRTVGLAAWMGFRRIDVYGADCSFPGGVAHANGETIDDAFGHTSVMRGDIGGREFETRPDMLQCAVDLVRLVKAYPDRVRLMGDTLPVALMGYDDSYLDQVICRTLPGETAADVRRRVFGDTLQVGA